MLPPAGPGDLIVIYQSGAYGFSASPKDFLSHPHPAEVFL
jgi:diaminopimelate decarboxylase